MGKVWGANASRREDQLKRMLSKALGAKRKEALERLTESQKTFALEVLTDSLGMNNREMGWIIEGLDCNIEKE